MHGCQGEQSLFARLKAQYQQAVMAVREGSLSDEELMLAVCRGDQTAFAQLYRRYQQKLYNFALRYTGDANTAEEIFQETFLKVYSLRHQYEVRAAFSTLLYTIARNLCLDFLKGRERRIRTLSPLTTATAPSGDLPDLRPNPFEQLETLEREALLRRAIAELPEPERAVLILSRYQGLQYMEVAKILGISVEAVKVRAHRGLKTLRARLCS